MRRPPTCRYDFDFTGAVGTQECVDDGFATWKAEIATADAWLDTRSDADLLRECIDGRTGQ